MKQYHINPKDVEKILSKYKLGSLISIEEIKTGLINPVYRINSKYILRIELHAYEQNPNKLKKESILFRILPKYHIPTPQLVGFDDSKEILDTPYILLLFISGTNLKESFNNLNESSKKAISYQLGEIAKKIHSVTYQDLESNSIFGNINDWVTKSVRDFKAYWMVVKDKDYLSNEVKDDITNTFDTFKRLDFDRNNISRLTHGDFSASNIQVDNSNIVGIFDFEYSFIADPLWDLQKLPLSFQLGDDFSREDFLKGYGVTEFTDEEKIRLKMYCFHQGVWELWATITNFMPFGDKEIEEGKNLIISTIRYKLL